MVYPKWCDRVRGAAYHRQLRGQPGIKSAHTILLVSDRTLPTDEALQFAIRTAVREQSSLSLLHVNRDDSGLRRSFELGELLTSRALRISEGQLPPLMTVIVYLGAVDDLVDVIAATTRPTLVITPLRRACDPGSNLPEDIGRAQGCPVLLVPTSECETGDVEDLAVGQDAGALLN